MSNHLHNSAGSSGQPWNKGRLMGPKPPLKLREIWAIRIRLQLADRKRDLALFNLAIDSKLRGFDLVKLMVQDVAHGGKAVSRTTVLQRSLRTGTGCWNRISHEGSSKPLRPGPARRD